MRVKGNRMPGIRILHEDLDVIVVEKEAGILSQELRHGDNPSVEGMLTDYVRKGQWKSSKRVYLVHRLDRETSGVMMVAKSERVQQWMRDHWNEITRKTYLARVEGELDAESGVFESYLREDENFFVKSVKNIKYGKFARTEWKKVPSSRFQVSGSRFQVQGSKFKVQRSRSQAPKPVPLNPEPGTLNLEPGTLNSEPGTLNSDSTLVEVALKSGRKNQIRVHFSEAGHPVVGDAKYGHGHRGDTLCLHAWKLSFKHPHTGKILSFETEPPAFAGNMVK